ncbi:ras-associating and dilute domain-containing protein-like isoform X2 [Styela clava]
MKPKDQKMEESTYMSFDTLDMDSIILPSLPSKSSSDPFEWTKKDEILLDPEDRPLDLAVNANSAVTFNIVSGSDRTAEVLRNIQSGSFTPQQRRKLMEKFNIDDDNMSSSDFGGTRTSQSSASESTGKCDSLEGSPITNERTRTSRLRSSLSQVKSQTGKGKEIPQKTSSDIRKLDHLQNDNAKNIDKRPVLSVTTIPKHNGKVQGKTGKKSQPSQNRQGRETTVSASARKILSSLRKTGRGRSASRDRVERQSPVKSPPQPSPTQDDLSSDVHLPGILKIFGDAVSPGANYKSVLATRQSKARELVKAALERYGVPRSMSKKFVLCEVVGRLRMEKIPVKLKETGKEGKPGYSVVVTHQESNITKDILDEKFVEDYVRPLNDHEKPLVLQSLWKPLEGYARRFELRDRTQVLDLIKTEKDTQTRDVNAQAKRIIMKNARLSRTQSSLSIKVPAHDDDGSSSDEEDGERQKQFKTIADKNNRNSIESATLPTPAQFADDETAVNSEATDGTPVPFLITLQGEDGVSSNTGKDRGGSLVHYLDTKVTVIGRNRVEPTTEGEPTPGTTNEVNIELLDEEIKQHHCVIYRVKDDENTNLKTPSKAPWKVTLHLVADDCDVTVNGQSVASDKELANGDVITVGSKYIFMLKDPTSKSDLNTNMRLGGLNPSVNRLNSIASRGSAFTPVKKRYVEMEINYRSEYEDHVLDLIFTAANDILAISSSKVHSEICNRELAPARLLIHCIEQACFNFTTEQKRSLLFVVATNLQTILLDATGSVSLQDDAKIKNPEEGINYILPKLEAVVFWMSNSLEIFSYLQADFVERIKTRVAKEIELNEVDQTLLNEASGFRVSDDILAVLEEVVMYAFQQLVYYLTKTLYGALPTVLDTNPFSEVSDETDSVKGTGHVIAIYEAALGLTRKYGVHPAIESQLFAYLFFFTNVSLFNTLMEEDAASKYYRWDKGVQIRGNLEEIECWANDKGFQEQASEFLLKFSTLTNLLATTKTQMLQSTWSCFRRDFPQLHPVQLRQVLDEYILGPRVKKRPADWIPDAVDLEESSEEDYLQESYDNHPPLVLPTDGTQIDLEAIPAEPWYMSLREVLLAVGQGCDVGNLQLQESWIPNPSKNNTIVGERQQPDGHEIPPGYHPHFSHSSLSSSTTSSTTGKTTTTINSNNNNKNYHRTKSLNQGDIHEHVKTSVRSTSPSSTSMSSILSDSTSHASFIGDGKQNLASPSSYNSDISSPVPAPRGVQAPIPSPRNHKSHGSHSKKGTSKTNDKHTRAPMKYATLDRPSRKAKRKAQQQAKAALTDDQSCDYNSLLPSHQKEETRLQHQQFPTSAFPEMTNNKLHTLPSEVFIVDVVKGRNGLGLGLVDGMYTSLQVPGVFVRSLVPDGPSVKHVRMKHQEVIKCWLQEGRLLLGDRILAINGTSLISMNYTSAMEELRLSGDRMRFLVGRSGADVAMRITSSSC